MGRLVEPLLQLVEDDVVAVTAARVGSYGAQRDVEPASARVPLDRHLKGGKEKEESRRGGGLECDAKRLRDLVQNGAKLTKALSPKYRTHDDKPVLWKQTFAWRHCDLLGVESSGDDS